MTHEEEQRQLQERFEKRVQCWQEHGQALLKSIGGDRAKAKGIKNRKWVCMWLQNLATIKPQTVDEEYKAVQKFGRGVWAVADSPTFNAEELKIIRLFATEYGAFDY